MVTLSNCFISMPTCLPIFYSSSLSFTALPSSLLPSPSNPQSHRRFLYYWHRQDESGLRMGRWGERERKKESERDSSVTLNSLTWRVTLTPSRTQVSIIQRCTHTHNLIKQEKELKTQWSWFTKHKVLFWSKRWLHRETAATLQLLGKI